MSNNPYELWNTRRSMGVVREVDVIPNYWIGIGFSRVLESTEEYIDFEKIPASSDYIAPFVKPLIAGKTLDSDISTNFRFKPAYVKLNATVDVLQPLVKRFGIETPTLDVATLTPMQRLDLIKADITVRHVNAIERRFEWLASKALIDGKVTISGPDYPAVLVDFRRDANLTVVKIANYWGDVGVSIFDDIQLYCDRMFNAAHGSFPTRLTVGSDVWNIMRKDAEFMKHMDVNIRDPRATIERALISSGKVVRVGELLVGGASGASIEIYLYRDTYKDHETKLEVPFMSSKDIVLTGSDDAIMGYQCFGMIVDRMAEYQAARIFARNYMTTGDPVTENLLHQSSPLMVPLNPNATFKATVLP